MYSEAYLTLQRRISVSMIEYSHNHITLRSDQTNAIFSKYLTTISHVHFIISHWRLCIVTSTGLYNVVLSKVFV